MSPPSPFHSSNLKSFVWFERQGLNKRGHWRLYHTGRFVLDLIGGQGTRWRGRKPLCGWGHTPRGEMRWQTGSKVRPVEHKAGLSPCVFVWRDGIIIIPVSYLCRGFIVAVSWLLSHVDDVSTQSSMSKSAGYWMDLWTQWFPDWKALPSRWHCQVDWSKQSNVHQTSSSVMKLYPKSQIFILHPFNMGLSSLPPPWSPWWQFAVRWGWGCWRSCSLRRARLSRWPKPQTGTPRKNQKHQISVSGLI